MTFNTHYFNEKKRIALEELNGWHCGEIDRINAIYINEQEELSRRWSGFGRSGSPKARQLFENLDRERLNKINQLKMEAERRKQLIFLEYSKNIHDLQTQRAIDDKPTYASLTSEPPWTEKDSQKAKHWDLIEKLSKREAACLCKGLWPDETDDGKYDANDCHLVERLILQEHSRGRLKNHGYWSSGGYGNEYKFARKDVIAFAKSRSDFPLTLFPDRRPTPAPSPAIGGEAEQHGLRPQFLYSENETTDKPIVATKSWGHKKFITALEFAKILNRFMGRTEKQVGEVFSQLQAHIEGKWKKAFRHEDVKTSFHAAKESSRPPRILAVQLPGGFREHSIVETPIEDVMLKWDTCRGYAKKEYQFDLPLLMTDAISFRPKRRKPRPQKDEAGHQNIPRKGFHVIGDDYSTVYTNGKQYRLSTDRRREIVKILHEKNDWMTIADIQAAVKHRTSEHIIKASFKGSKAEKIRIALLENDKKGRWRIIKR